MRVLRSRVIPMADAETPSKKPKPSAEIDPSAAVPDDAVGTPPSPRLVPSADERDRRSATPLTQPRRSLRLASAAQRGGTAEGLPPPPQGSVEDDDGAVEGSSSPEEEKPEEVKLDGEGDRIGRTERGKRKLEVNAGLIDSAGFLSLRTGKSVARRVGDSGTNENSVSVIEDERNDELVLSQANGVSAREIDNGRMISNLVEIASPKSRKILRSEEKGKGKLDRNELVDLGSRGTGSETRFRARGKYSSEEKGKAKVSKDSAMDLNLELKKLGAELESLGKQLEKMRSDDRVCAAVAVADQIRTRSKRARENAGESSSANIRGRFRDIARRNASRFAHFNPDDEVGDNLPVEAARNLNVAPQEANPEPEHWPGPFSTAMKIIRDRAAKISTRQSNSSWYQSKSAITWVPNIEGRGQAKRSAPSLMDLCLNVLAANADAITSLDGVPDIPRHKLSQMLCDSRKMNKHFLDLLVGGSPTEIRIKDCSWLTEEELTECFREFDTSSLTVLQLDQCGRCLPDYVIFSSISHSANCLPALSTVSITGACRLTDGGLATLIASAPALRSINLNQCSLLTYRSIEVLVNTLGLVLKELYINDCQSIEAMLMLPALKKLENLQVLSVAGIPSVCDDFIMEFIGLRGQNIRELVLRDCMNLTDASLKAIAETCPGLLALNLSNLTKLTDSSVGYLANGCQAMENMILRHNTFSDEAVAAFLETSGEQLQELSLNNVKKVGPNTAISLAKRARKLRRLDLSWCRNLTDEALGFIVDSCSYLKELRVFGCSQITDTFLHGHSNTELQIIGLKMSTLLEHCRVAVPEHPLKYF